MNVSERVTPEREGRRHPLNIALQNDFMASHPAQPVLSEFYLGFPVIRNTFGGDIIPRMVESFGPLPAEWKGRLFWEYKDHWYDQDTKNQILKAPSKSK